MLHIFTTHSMFISRGRAQLTSSVPLHCCNIICRLIPASPFFFLKSERGKFVWKAPVRKRGPSPVPTYSQALPLLWEEGGKSAFSWHSMVSMHPVTGPRTITLASYILLNHLMKKNNTGNLCKAGEVLA